MVGDGRCTTHYPTLRGSQAGKRQPETLGQGPSRAVGALLGAEGQVVMISSARE